MLTEFADSRGKFFLQASRRFLYSSGTSETTRNHKTPTFIFPYIHFIQFYIPFKGAIYYSPCKGLVGRWAVRRWGHWSILADLDCFVTCSELSQDFFRTFTGLISHIFSINFKTSGSRCFGEYLWSFV